MFTKTMFAILTALVLTTSYVSAQQVDRRGCVPANTEEGALSAIPAWRVC